MIGLRGPRRDRWSTAVNRRLESLLQPRYAEVDVFGQARAPAAVTVYLPSSFTSAPDDSDIGYRGAMLLLLAIENFENLRGPAWRRRVTSSAFSLGSPY
jgi:hypothetical protein